MKLLIVLLAALAVVSAMDYAYYPQPVLGVRDVHQECANETHLTDEQVSKVENLEFPDEEQVRNYVLCGVTRLRLFNKVTGFEKSRVHMQMDLKMDDDEVLPILDKCLDKNEEKSTPNVWAFRVVHCIMDSKAGEELREILKRLKAKVAEEKELEDGWYGQRAEGVREIHRECATENHLTAQQLRRVENMVFPDEENIRSYVLCFVNRMRIFDQVNGFRKERLFQVIDSRMDDEVVKPILDKCLDMNEQKSTPDVWTFRVLQCLLNTKVGNEGRVVFRRQKDKLTRLPWQPQPIEVVWGVNIDCIKDSQFSDQQLAKIQNLELEDEEKIREYVLCNVNKLRLFCSVMGYHKDRVLSQLDLNMDDDKVMHILDECLDKNEQKSAPDVWAFRGMQCLLKSKAGDEIQNKFKLKSEIMQHKANPEEEWYPQAPASIRGIHRECAMETHLSDEQKAQILKMEFPDEEPVKKYVACGLDRMRLFSPIVGLHPYRVHKQMSLKMPKEEEMPLLQACTADEKRGNDDPDTWAFRQAQCILKSKLGEEIKTNYEKYRDIMSWAEWLPQNAEGIRNIHRECAKETELSDEQLANVENMELSDEEKVQKYVFCGVRKLRLFCMVSGFHTDRVLQQMDLRMDDSKVNKILSDCMGPSEKKNSPVETAFNGVQCVLKSKAGAELKEILKKQKEKLAAAV